MEIQADKNRVISFGVFQLDTLDMKLRRDGQSLELTPKALDVLHYLLLHSARLVRKKELLEAVWSQSHVSEAVIKVCIREIRKTLGDEAATPRFIETVRSRGYRFVGNIQLSTSESSSSQSRTPAREEPVTESLAPPSVSPPWHSRVPGRSVGREGAFAELQKRLERACHGERQIVFITGEAGIGKTTTVNRFLEGLGPESAYWIARGQCLEQYGAGEAFMPVLEAFSQLCRKPGGEQIIAALRRVAPTWLAQMPFLADNNEQESLRYQILGATPERMLREMAEVLELLSPERPLVLSLEDLHWSDYSTLDLISFLAHRLEPARLLLLGTYRPVEAVLTQHPIKSIKQELEIHRRCCELPLEFLTESAVGEYLRERLQETDLPVRLARWIHQRTDGNPLFMVNLVNYLIDQEMLVCREGQWELAVVLEKVQCGVPENLRQMIESQIHRLSSQEQRVLEAASVTGMSFSAAAAAAAMNFDTLKVEECCEALARRSHFLSGQDLEELPDGRFLARFGFIHALYQNVLYQNIPEGRRLRLHHRVGEFLESAHVKHTGGIAAELAAHFQQARDYVRAVRYLRAAAEHAVRRYANREAIGYLSQALACMERLPPSDQKVTSRKLLEQRALAQRSMGDMKGAAEDFEAVASIAREQGLLQEEVKAVFQLCVAFSWFDVNRCEATCELAVERSTLLADELLQAHARGSAAYLNLLLRGWRNEDLQASAEAVDTARKAEDLTLLSLHLGRYSYFRCLRSDYQEAWRATQEGQQLAMQIGSVFDYMLGQFFEAWALLHAGRWGEMLGTLKRASEMAEKNGHQLWLTLYELELGWLHEQAFGFLRASELCFQGLQKARKLQFGYGELMSSVLLGFTQLGLENYDEALRTFNDITERLAKERRLMDWIWRIPLALGLSRCWLSRGDLRASRMHAQTAVDLAAVPGEQTWVALGWNCLAEASLHEKDAARAERELQRAFQAVSKAEAPLAEWRVCCTAGHVHEHQGHRDEANVYWRRSAGVLKGLLDSLGAEEELRQSLLTSPRLPPEVRGELAAQQETGIAPVLPMGTRRPTQGKPGPLPRARDHKDNRSARRD